MRRLAVATAGFALSSSLVAQVSTSRPDSSRRQAAEQHVPKRSRADTLRGSFTTPGRTWWDVTFYDLHVAVQPNDSSIAGYNGITYKVLEPAAEMQIDLMEPLVVDSMVQDGRKVRNRREGAAFFAALTAPQRAGELKTITVYYHGRPQIAKNPPWQGGFSWSTDSLGRPWVVTTDQGIRGLNKTFWHQTVMGKQIQEYISAQAGMNLSKVFDQYLRTTMVPTFEYRIAGDTLSYRWANVVPGFDMPIRVTLDWPTFTLLKPTETWQTATVHLGNPSDFRVDDNFYVVPKAVDATSRP